MSNIESNSDQSQVQQLSLRGMDFTTACEPSQHILSPVEGRPHIVACEQCNFTRTALKEWIGHPLSEADVETAPGLQAMLSDVIENVPRAVQNGQFLKALWRLESGVFGQPVTKPLFNRVISGLADGHWKITLPEYDMYTHTEDSGLSQELIENGIREEISYRSFRQEIQRLCQSVDNITALEVGANIGYYALLVAALIRDAGTGTVHAYEPSKRSLNLLEQNIELNSLQPFITCHQRALGEEAQQATFNELSQWNVSHISLDQRESPHHSSVERSYEIEVSTVRDELDRLDKSPTDINVVRMDIEGHEASVFDSGIEPILKGSQPLVVFVELHHCYLDNNSQNRIIQFLQESPLEPQSIAVVDLSPEGVYRTLPELEPLKRVDTVSELVLSRSFNRV